MKMLILSFILLLTVSCSKNDEDTSVEPQVITPDLVAKGHLNNNTIYTRQNIIISNNNDWQTLLSNFNSIDNKITDTFKETNIDFNTYQIVVAIDVRNSSSSVDVANIIENVNNITVTIKNIQMGVTNDVALPFHIVKIQKSTKPVVFE
jgi:hypothetical protein